MLSAHRRCSVLEARSKVEIGLGLIVIDLAGERGQTDEDLIALDVPMRGQVAC